MLLTKHLGGPTGKGNHPDGSPQSVHTAKGRAAWKAKQAGKASKSTGLPKGIKPSSLDLALSGKAMGKKTVANVYKDPNPIHAKDRLVTFGDGSWKYVPSAVLASVVYGKDKSKGLIFKSDKALHESGFTSHLQAAYLKQQKPDVFNQIVEAAKRGERKWDAKAKKIVLLKSQAPWITTRDLYYRGYDLSKELSSEEVNDLADDDLFTQIESMSEEEIISRWFEGE